jgi:hypothetical protein
VGNTFEVDAGIAIGRLVKIVESKPSFEHSTQVTMRETPLVEDRKNAAEGPMVDLMADLRVELNGRDVFIDFTLRTATGTTSEHQDPKSDRTTVEDAAKEKHKHYTKYAQYPKEILVPFAVDHWGAFNKEALSFLQDASQLSKNQTKYQPPPEWLDNGMEVYSPALRRALEEISFARCRAVHMFFNTCKTGKLPNGNNRQQAEASVVVRKKRESEQASAQAQVASQPVDVTDVANNLSLIAICGWRRT